MRESRSDDDEPQQKRCRCDHSDDLHEELVFLRRERQELLRLNQDLREELEDQRRRSNLQDLEFRLGELAADQLFHFHRLRRSMDSLQRRVEELVRISSAFQCRRSCGLSNLLGAIVRRPLN